MYWRWVIMLIEHIMYQLWNHIDGIGIFVHSTSILPSLQTKLYIIVNSVDPVEAAHYEPSHQYVYFL